MSKIREIRVEQDSVNDDRVLIRSWHITDNSYVKKDTLLLTVENSKSINEISSPCDGFVLKIAREDEEVKIGESLCCICENLESLHEAQKRISNIVVDSASIKQTITSVKNLSEQSICLENKLTLSPQSDFDTVSILSRQNDKADYKTTRFSRKALNYLEQHSLSPDDFKNQGLIRVADLIQQNSQQIKDHAKKPEREYTTVQKTHQHSVPTITEKLSFQKRSEINNISWGHRHVLRSSVSCPVITRGRDVLSGYQANYTDLLAAEIIYRSGRLLMDYPELNAFMESEDAHYYQEINIGYALDAGHGLIVPVIPHVNHKNSSEVAQQRSKLINAYLDQKLTPQDLSGATFTITDLSSSKISSFDPLIPAYQSAILGIGGEFSCQLGKNAYQLILAFDHRLSEGRKATKFLQEMKFHLEQFEEHFLMTNSYEHSLPEVHCDRCGQTWTEAKSHGHFLLPVISSPQGMQTLICTICVEGR